MKRLGYYVGRPLGNVALMACEDLPFEEVLNHNGENRGNVIGITLVQDIKGLLHPFWFTPSSMMI